jgi:hypothetical protein
VNPDRRPTRSHGSRTSGRTSRPTNNGRSSRNSSRSDAHRWLPAIGAAAVLGAVIVAGVALGGNDGADVTADPSVDGTLLDVVVPPSVDAIGTVATSTPIVKSTLDRTLADGVAGDDVKQVQARLTELGFWPGPADGVYGTQTIQAVWAFEKLVMGVERSAASGRVTPEMWDRMQDPIAIGPRRPNATTNHVEIYLPEQVMVIFHDDRPVMISHISSGDGEEWCEEVTISPGEYGNEQGTEPIKRGECGISKTPGGVFTVYRQVAGIRQSALGGMYNPVYFNYGIAIHGALNVPLQPASHGCIRIPNAYSKDMQDMIENGDQVYVWDGEKEPEQQSEQERLPIFNYPDPNYSTTTTSTTTTTTTTTTIAPPPTTAKPVPTTTTTKPVTPTTPPVATTTTAPAP